jgi:hypothetical protein
MDDINEAPVTYPVNDHKSVNATFVRCSPDAIRSFHWLQLVGDPLGLLQGVWDDMIAKTEDCSVPDDRNCLEGHSPPDQVQQVPHMFVGSLVPDQFLPPQLPHQHIGEAAARRESEGQLIGLV